MKMWIMIQGLLYLFADKGTFINLQEKVVCFEGQDAMR